MTMTTLGRILFSIAIGTLLTFLVFLSAPWADQLHRAVWVVFSILAYLLSTITEDLR